MSKILRWKRGAFSSTYEIYENDHLIGKLKDSTFRQSSEGMIHQKGYRFKTKGLFKQETHIIDAEREQVIGTISYNSWKSRASIQLDKGIIQWKYDNTWQTRWSLYSDSGIQMNFKGGMSKGTIESDRMDDLLVLTGLFVTNYYRQMAVVIMVAVFLPTWVSIMN